MLKKFVDIDVDSSHDTSKSKEEGLQQGATASTNAMETEEVYSCRNCDFKSSSYDILNKHNRDEHIRTSFPCTLCDFQAYSMKYLREHQLDEHNYTGAGQKDNKYSCDQCDFQSKTEHSLEEHKSIEHVHRFAIKCHLCDYEFGAESDLLLHEEETHKKSRFECSECNKNFPSTKRLQEHRQYKHSSISWFPCDHCGKRFTTISSLDEHIKYNHSSHCSTESRSRKDIDMRDLRHRKPCNPADPAHSSKCCDRRPKERQNKEGRTLKSPNGPCRYWNKDENCYFGEECRFSHVYICQFQESCHYGPQECKFYHFGSKEQESSFLGRRSQGRYQERRR